MTKRYTDIRRQANGYWRVTLFEYPHGRERLLMTVTCDDEDKARQFAIKFWNDRRKSKESALWNDQTLADA